MIRLVAIIAGAVVVWLVTAMQVPSHQRMPVATVVIGAKVSQPYGCSDLALEPLDRSCPSHHIHTGIDLAVREGTEVHSATAGMALVGYDPAGAGNYVVVVVDEHVRVIYCHLSEFQVTSGEVVAPGEVIGLVGATGLATGPHVHLQVNIDGVPIDPDAYLGS